MARIVFKDIQVVETLDASGLKQVVGGSFSWGRDPGLHQLALPDLDAGANAAQKVSYLKYGFMKLGGGGGGFDPYLKLDGIKGDGSV
jgi:hypothetical protein